MTRVMTVHQRKESRAMEINLFRIQSKGLTKLESSASRIEKRLQDLFEKNLETLLGVRFLASEYPITNGRIDTLGIDENNSPVIIEYKRTRDENVVNQGLFYLDWLMDHKSDFKILVGDRLGKDIVTKIEWNAPRLICVAAEFSKYDTHAVKQMNRNIELVCYRRFSDNLLLLELLTKISGKSSSAPVSVPTTDNISKKQITVSQSLENATPELKYLYSEVEDFIMSLGDDINKEVLQYYFAFRQIKNFVCVDIRHTKKKILLYLKINPDELQIEKGFTRDVREVGHTATGDLEVTLKTNDDLERAKELIQKSYEES